MKLYEVIMAHIKDKFKPNLNAIKNVKKGEELYMIIMPTDIEHIKRQLEKKYNVNTLTILQNEMEPIIKRKLMEIFTENINIFKIRVTSKIKQVGFQNATITTITYEITERPRRWHILPIHKEITIYDDEAYGNTVDVETREIPYYMEQTAVQTTATIARNKQNLRDKVNKAYKKLTKQTRTLKDHILERKLLDNFKKETIKLMI